MVNELPQITRAKELLKTVRHAAMATGQCRCEPATYVVGKNLILIRSYAINFDLACHFER